jgi:3-methyladenine DNA glycosylase Mpg
MKRAHEVIVIDDSDEEVPVKKQRIAPKPAEVTTEKVSNNLILPARLLTKQTTMLDFEEHFTHIADYLFNKVALCLKGTQTMCRIVEIEFYLTTHDDVHADPFTHCHTLHHTHGQWYFHQNQTRVNDHNFKGGNYKGLDCTFGVENSHYGGILIRSLEALSTKEIIDGPSKCVDFILQQNDATSLRDFTTKFLTNDTLLVDPVTKDHPLSLRPMHYKNKYHVLSGSRIGLSLMQANKQSARAGFVLRQYRYYTHPVKTKKGRNQMVASMYVQEAKKIRNMTSSARTKLIEKIAAALNVSKKNVERYVDIIEEGRMKSVVKKSDGSIDLENMREFFAKSLTSDEIVRMHGVLYPIL